MSALVTCEPFLKCVFVLKASKVCIQTWPIFQQVDSSLFSPVCVWSIVGLTHSKHSESSYLLAVFSDKRKRSQRHLRALRHLHPFPACESACHSSASRGSSAGGCTLVGAAFLGKPKGGCQRERISHVHRLSPIQNPTRMCSVQARLGRSNKLTFRMIQKDLGSRSSQSGPTSWFQRSEPVDGRNLPPHDDSMLINCLQIPR